MSDKLFLENQFKRKNIPEGSGKYDDFLLCKKLIQSQSKLSPQIYNEHLKIAVEYCKV